MKKIMVYQTSDGELFKGENNRVEANQWQRRLDVIALFGEDDPIDVLDENTDQIFAYLKAKRKSTPAAE